MSRRRRRRPRASGRASPSRRRASSRLTPRPPAAAERLGGCADYQSLIPSYLRGELSPARALLLEDHRHECIPCRKALKSARTGEPQVAARAAQVNPRPARHTSFTPVWRWSIAAGLLLCFGLAGLFFVERLDLSGRTLAATVESADGPLYLVSDTESRALRTGEQIQKGERVRTAKDSNAVLRLADGSTVEMRERSEVSVTENMRGVTVRLERGDVIVEAAKQRNGRLYVARPIRSSPSRARSSRSKAARRARAFRSSKAKCRSIMPAKTKRCFPAIRRRPTRVSKPSRSAESRLEPQRRALHATRFGVGEAAAGHQRESRAPRRALHFALPRPRARRHCLLRRAA